ncbi:MAG: CPBP family intramembrane metalloprotease [Ruminococcus sp.]|nr:CPBP family intramembrane metalloprotease [Ruminococcus sp.]MBQ7070680.1 CPBP family intramembrane metalloprotease [Ruminococcus sp.]
MADNNEYMIDVAKEATYLNQSDEYRRLYAQWRADPENLYGYQFVHDTREHSYIDGKGYVPHLAEVAESISLVKCCSLMGSCLLITLMLDIIWYFISLAAFPEQSGIYIYRSQLAKPPEASLLFVLASGIHTALRYLLPTVVFAKVSGIPKKVALPRSRRRLDLLGNSIIIMLLIMLLGRILNPLLGIIFSWINVDTMYSLTYFSRDPATIIVTFIFTCLLMPILQEILCRGVMLQALRQFGDLFAVIATSLITAMMFYDFTYYGQVAICFVVLSVVTIRTGSIITPIIMSIISHTLNFTLSYITLLGIEQAQLIEALVCTAVIGTSIIAYSKLMNDRHKLLTVTQTVTGLRFIKKIQLLITSTTVTLWISASIVMTFIVMRLLK